MFWLILQCTETLMLASSNELDMHTCPQKNKPVTVTCFPALYLFQIISYANSTILGIVVAALDIFSPRIPFW